MIFLLEVRESLPRFRRYEALWSVGTLVSVGNVKRSELEISPRQVNFSYPANKSQLMGGNIPVYFDISKQEELFRNGFRATFDWIFENQDQ